MGLGKLENQLGHRFKSPALLERALTHGSWAHENSRPVDSGRVRELENETLEFLGDSVLGLAVADHLFSKHPGLSEGDLTRMKHQLVRMSSLSSAAERLGLGEHLRLSKGEESLGGREKPTILADTLEAIIGAIFLDGGYIAARAFVARILAEEFRSVSPESSRDNKSRLLELFQAEKREPPTFNVIATEGPPNDRKFTVEAIWDGGRVIGEGRSIKSAEMAASEQALDQLGWSK
jgi:ribonuclease III